MRNRTLFVSFTGLVRKLTRGEINPRDFAGALYYFGCCRAALLDATGPMDTDAVIEEHCFRYSIRDEHQGRRLADAIRTVQEHVAIAEREGRVAWRSDARTSNSYGQLNELFARHDLAPLTSDSIDDDGGLYCYPGVERRIKLAGLPVAVVQ